MPGNPKKRKGMKRYADNYASMPNLSQSQQIDPRMMQQMQQMQQMNPMQTMNPMQSMNNMQSMNLMQEMPTMAAMSHRSTMNHNDIDAEYVNTEEYKPTKDLYFDTKEAYRGAKDERLDYFLPPLEDANKKTNLMYPTVLDDDMIMTSKGILPRTSRRS